MLASQNGVDRFMAMYNSASPMQNLNVQMNSLSLGQSGNQTHLAVQQNPAAVYGPLQGNGIGAYPAADVYMPNASTNATAAPAFTSGVVVSSAAAPNKLLHGANNSFSAKISSG